VNSDTHRPRRGRPRKEGAEERIIEAALEEYARCGWAGFTMDAVARRAGVGKSTVYLRWNDKDSLLTEAVNARSGGIEAVDTGSFRGDLEAVAVNLYRFLIDPVGWAILRIAVDAAGSPEPLGRFTENVSGRHRQAAATVIERAIARKEAPEDLPVQTLVECLYGAVLMQALTVSGEARNLDDDAIQRRARHLVGFILTGCAGSN
jgi:AcrR family transcriptional regulator